MKKLANI